MALFLSIFPIVLLIYLMVKRNALPSYLALPDCRCCINYSVSFRYRY